MLFALKPDYPLRTLEIADKAGVPKGTINAFLRKEFGFFKNESGPGWVYHHEYDRSSPLNNRPDHAVREVGSAV